MSKRSQRLTKQTARVGIIGTGGISFEAAIER
jgi:hypothetical protein